MEEKKQDQTSKKPIYKKWWFWLIIGVVVLGIIGSIIGGTAGSSTNSGTNSGGNSSQTKTYGMNETVTVGDLQYKITNVYDTVKVGSLGETTSNNYVVITLVIKNNSSSEKSLTSSYFTYCRGNNKYEPSTQAMYLNSSTNPFLALEKVGAGISKTITVVYEIPSEHASTDYLQVKDSFKTEKIYMK